MSNILPIVNESGCYEIRLESIGGLGANLCGKMLGELGALYLDLNASSFSGYGSEKRGAPVKSHIRFCDPKRDIRINSPVVKPHLLVVFHEALLDLPSTLEGVTPDTLILLNTPRAPGELPEEKRPAAGTLFCLDALRLAGRYRSRINMVLLGAIVRVTGFIPLCAAEKMCRETVGKKYPSLIEENVNGLRAGYENISRGEVLTSSSEKAVLPSVPPQGVPIGGVNIRPGSTVTNDLSPSREGYFPLFDRERCINCGLCDSTCPDMVFQFAPGEYNGRACMVNTGLDYLHCKGCLRCVEICPTHALTMAKEKDYPEKPWSRQNRHLLPDGVRYEKSGPNPWVTGDSYLTEKRVDGGAV